MAILIFNSGVTRTLGSSLPCFKMVRTIRCTSSQCDLGRLEEIIRFFFSLKSLGTYKVIREAIVVFIKVAREASTCISTNGVTHLTIAIVVTDIVLINSTPNVKGVSVVSSNKNQGIFIFAIFLF